MFKDICSEYKLHLIHIQASKCFLGTPEEVTVIQCESYKSM